MATLEQRVKDLEVRIQKPERTVLCVIRDPLAADLAQIDARIREADERGDLVIIQNIVDPGESHHGNT